MTERRFPPPWTVEKIPGGLKVCDANGQDAHMAKVLTEDEARRIASNIGGSYELRKGPIYNIPFCGAGVDTSPRRAGLS